MKKNREKLVVALFMILGIGVFFNLASTTSAGPPDKVPPGQEKKKGPPGDELTQEELVEEGRRLFFEETFDGNGRTCGTCHPAENNFTIEPAFIATLPPTDPLFVAEFVPALAELERPELMRKLGLILENLNGFGDPEDLGFMRGVPHTLAMRTSLNPAANQFVDPPPDFPAEATGWSGDGAPFGDPANDEDGSLRAFSIGAVRQHFPKTLNRVEGDDFRLPTDLELDALEAFMLSLGRQDEVDVGSGDPTGSSGIEFNDPIVERGKELFNTVGKCQLCHFNAGANNQGSCLGGECENRNFNTGGEDQADLPANVLDPSIPTDDGFGLLGDSLNGTFNTPVLVEAADTPPFFHNNSASTIEAAVAFFSGPAFNATGLAGGIELDGSQVTAIAAFLRALNALENIRSSTELNTFAMGAERQRGTEALQQSVAETEDAIEVLTGGVFELYGDTVALLQKAMALEQDAVTRQGKGVRRRLLTDANQLLTSARNMIATM